MHGNIFVPKKVFFTTGVGTHKEQLASFELALRNAKIEKYNLVTVSSILPPNCEIIERDEGLQYLEPGQIVFCVLSKNSSNEPGRKITASIGLALPKDPNIYGYLSEYHGFGLSKEEAGEYAEDMAAYMLGTTFGIPNDVEWDETKEIWKMDDRIVKSSNVTAYATVTSKKWTTVVAAAVFIL